MMTEQGYEEVQECARLGRHFPAARVDRVKGGVELGRTYLMIRQERYQITISNGLPDSRLLHNDQAETAHCAGEQRSATIRLEVPRYRYFHCGRVLGEAPAVVVILRPKDKAIVFYEVLRSGGMTAPFQISRTATENPAARAQAARYQT